MGLAILFAALGCALVPCGQDCKMDEACPPGGLINQSLVKKCREHGHRKLPVLLQKLRQ